MAYLKRILITLLSIIISLLLITTLYYFDIINTTVYKYLKLFTLLANILISSFILGKNTTAKGYIEGLKNGLIFIALFIVISLLLKIKLPIKSILYYFIILLTSTLGSMFGISKKRKDI